MGYNIIEWYNVLMKAGAARRSQHRWAPHRRETGLAWGSQGHYVVLKYSVYVHTFVCIYIYIYMF